MNKMQSQRQKGAVAVSRGIAGAITEPIQSAADARGHGPQTAGSGIGGLVGGMLGSFAGPAGALLGAGLGAAVGYALCD